MCNILVVDDEELLCLGLKTILEGLNHPQISHIYTCINPFEVGNLIEEHGIDIVFTDIRMPGKTGLDIIKEVSEYNSDIKFVVLSGYDDFHYVKGAFKLGVNEYLLKPCSIGEINDALENVLKLISIRDSKSFDTPIFENTLNKIIRISEDSVLISRLCENNNIHFKHQYFCTSIVHTPNILKENFSSFIKANKLKDIFESEYNYKNGIDLYHFFDYDNNLVLLFNLENDSTYLFDYILDYLCQIVQIALKKYSYDLICTVSEIEKDLSSISSSYHKAKECIEYKVVFCEDLVIKFSEIKNRTSNVDNKKYIQGLKVSIEDLSLDDALYYIDLIFSLEAANKYKIIVLQEAYDSIISMIYFFCNMYQFTVFSSEHHIFSAFTSIYKVKEYLKDLVKDLIDKMNIHAGSKRLIVRCEKFIMDNYDKDINLAVVANTLGVSYTYFSTLFKNETNTNFSDYLTKIRMEKALELLKNPQTKIQDVALHVGYENSKYFTRVFKHFFGAPPKEYLNSINNTDKIFKD
jgi:two-component system, response regulator YesN